MMRQWTRKPSAHENITSSSDLLRDEFDIKPEDIQLKESCDSVSSESESIPIQPSLSSYHASRSTLRSKRSHRYDKVQEFDIQPNVPDLIEEVKETNETEILDPEVQSSEMESYLEPS